MAQESFAARYRAAQRLAGGRCPSEAGLMGRLADHECRRGRLACRHSDPCGCWGEEGAVMRALTEPSGRPDGSQRRPIAD